MGNWFKEVGQGLIDVVKDPVKGALSGTSDLLKGNFSEAWDHFKHIPGDNERANSRVLKQFIGDNWLSQNPNTAAAALVTGGALGGLGGGGGALGPVTDLFKDPSLGFKPSGGWKDSASLADKKPGGWLESASDAIGGSDSYGGFGNKDNTGYAGKEGGLSANDLANILKSVKGDDQKLTNMSSSGGRVGRGFNFNSKIYENPLLNREYGELYNEPLYKPMKR